MLVYSTYNLSQIEEKRGRAHQRNKNRRGRVVGTFFFYKSFFFFLREEIKIQELFFYKSCWDVLIT